MQAPSPHRQPRRRPMAEINVVPLIDVMLVLLVVFMITAPLITQGIKVDLPQANSEVVSETEQETLVVSIDAAGNYYVNLGDVSADDPVPTPLEQIQDSVSRILAASPAVPVYVEADAAIAYGTVMRLLAALEEAGAPSVRLITQPPGVGE